MNQQKLYDVYVSYPPKCNRDEINQAIKSSLSEEEAKELIETLSSHPQTIIAEKCTGEERTNAQQYFKHIGLDVIVRLSLELAPDLETESVQHNFTQTSLQQCPVCHTIIEDNRISKCPTCNLPLNTSSDIAIQRKRIEWQEKISFEHQKQHEITYKILKEKQLEEKKLRKQIRAELEQKLKEELGENKTWKKRLNYKKYLIAIAIMIAIFILIAIGYLAAKL
mgnify:CR=1 FL=1